MAAEASTRLSSLDSLRLPLSVAPRSRRPARSRVGGQKHGPTAPRASAASKPSSQPGKPRKVSAVATSAPAELDAESPPPRCAIEQQVASSPAAPDGAAIPGVGRAPSADLPKVAPEALSYPPGFLGAAPKRDLGREEGFSQDRLQYLRKILTSRVYDVAVETPLELAAKLSARIGNKILLKREDMQPVFSFKLRGAYNMMAHLTPEQLARGVICSSAGNHAQGVALSSSRLGCSAVIAMPVTTPEIKWRSVQRLGAEVVLVGDSYDATQAYAKARAQEEGRVFIPPFDDPLVIAGQGTVGMEILRQFSLPACQGLPQAAAPGSSSAVPSNGAPPRVGWPVIADEAYTSEDDSGICGMDGSCCSLHAVFVPIGGGGLIAGIAEYIKALQPEIKVIGVEPADANAMAHSLELGSRVQLSSCGTFADGVAVRVVGEETFRICQELVDGVVLVSRDAICAAIKDMFEETRSILEPAGALALAGAKAYCEHYGLKGETVVAVTSGANMNFDRLRLVSELADVGANREAVVATSMPEVPGAFREFALQVGPDMNITEFKYRYSNPDKAFVLFSVGVHKKEELEAMMARLDQAGMPTMDLTHNDLAKDHLRHLIGGKSVVPNEALFRFVFPERPGALMKFLDMLSPRWNITLFHYRRQGEMGANILVGVQVAPEEEEEFVAAASELGYEFMDERDNLALQLLMK